MEAILASQIWDAATWSGRYAMHPKWIHISNISDYINFKLKYYPMNIIL